MRHLLLLAAFCTIGLAATDDLPFRIRKVHDGLTYDLIFMPLKRDGTDNSASTLQYRISGRINGEPLHETAAPTESRNEGQKIITKYVSQNGVAFSITTEGARTMPTSDGFLGDKETNTSWFVSRIQKRRLAEHAMLQHYGFTSMTQFNLFKASNFDLIAELTAKGLNDPIGQAIVEARKARAQAVKPTNMVELKSKGRELKGDFHKNCKPIWDKGAYATWDEHQKLKETIQQIRTLQTAFIIILNKRGEGYSGTVQTNTGPVHGVPSLYTFHNDYGRSIKINGIIEECKMYDLKLRSTRMPDTRMYTRDEFNAIADIADAIFFVSGPEFNYPSDIYAFVSQIISSQYNLQESK